MEVELHLLLRVNINFPGYCQIIHQSGCKNLYSRLIIPPQQHLVLSDR